MKKRRNKAKFISLGSMLITLSVIFQSAPVFLPFVGLIISPFSTLPIMLATYFRLSLGVLTYISAAFLLMFVSIQESVIFLFTTGIFGIAIGAFLFRKSIIISIIISGIVLTFGMMTLTFAMGIAAFGDFTYKFSILSISIIFGAFSIIYASFWNIIVKQFILHMKKIKMFRDLENDFS